MSIIINFLKKMVPVPVKMTIKNWKILEIEYGHFLSCRRHSCIDKNGDPIPWYTYPAIEYIKQLDFSDKVVFEYGCGNSTLYWSSVAQHVVSVEDDPAWYERMANVINQNTEIHLATTKVAYVSEILQHDLFDVIVVDGSHRYSCAQLAVTRLKPGGMIILDNSDRFVTGAHVLHQSDLIQVDMAGFAPINTYTSTTSFFFHREFNFPSKGPDQPQHSIGGIIQYGDE